MKLLMTLLVKNEADIVRQNIQYHLDHGISHIIATDNGSSDGTREILCDYSAAGVLTLLDEEGDDYSQWKWVTRMALIARDHFGADWVLNNDADEFWWTPQQDLTAPLERSRARIIDCKRKNLVFAYDDPLPAGPWWERAVYSARSPSPITPPADRIRGSLKCPFYLHDLPSKALIPTEGLIGVEQGNHSAQYTSPMLREPSCSVTIFHFPVRSAQQFERKILQGGAAYERNKELRAEVGWHWRRWYYMVRTSGFSSALADALPSSSYLADGLRSGTIVTDRTIGMELSGVTGDKPKPE